MGAAFPFSIGSKYRKGVAKYRIVCDCLLRGIRLTFFAIFIQHLYPWVTSAPQDTSAWLLALLAFVLLCLIFTRIPVSMARWLRRSIELFGYGAGIWLLLNLSYANDRTFSLYYSNIIVLVLANMAIFGSIIYLFTINRPWLRIAILPFVMAVFLGSATEGSWVKEVMNFSPIPWLYKFYYLKYLFIILPGTIAGEYLYHWMQNRTTGQRSAIEKRRTPFVLCISIAIIVLNLYGLYTRHLILNLAGTALLLGALWYLLKAAGNNLNYWRKLFTAGAYLLMLGLFFEAYEGGIRKDQSTYSYYFVAAGLAFIAMITLSILSDVYSHRKITAPLELTGQNPMVAYVAPQLVILPLFHLTGLDHYLSLLTGGNPWLGLLHGVIITTLAILLTVAFTKLKCFWRT
jgi:predicted acyltransferase